MNVHTEQHTERRDPPELLSCSLPRPAWVDQVMLLASFRRWCKERPGGEQRVGVTLWFERRAT